MIRTQLVWLREKFFEWWLKWKQEKTGGGERWLITVNKLAVMKSGTTWNRNVAREESEKNTTGNRVYEAAGMNVRDGVDATRYPDGRNSWGRRRFYFPSDVQYACPSTVLVQQTFCADHSPCSADALRRPQSVFGRRFVLTSVVWGKVLFVWLAWPDRLALGYTLISFTARCPQGNSSWAFVASTQTYKGFYWLMNGPHIRQLIVVCTLGYRGIYLYGRASPRENGWLDRPLIEVRPENANFVTLLATGSTPLAPLDPFLILKWVMATPVVWNKGSKWWSTRYSHHRVKDLRLRKPHDSIASISVSMTSCRGVI